MVLLTLGSASVGYLGASFSSNPAVGIVLAVMMVTPMILFSGMLYERSQVLRTTHHPPPTTTTTTPGLD